MSKSLAVSKDFSFDWVDHLVLYSCRRVCVGVIVCVCVCVRVCMCFPASSLCVCACEQGIALLSPWVDLSESSTFQSKSWENNNQVDYLRYT